MGLELFSPDEDRSAVVTAIRAPEGIDSGELVLALRDRFGITLAPGQGALKGKVFRIGHIGCFDVFDITTALAGGRARARRGRRGHRARRRAVTAALEAFEQPLARGVKVLVREPIAEAGVELLQRALRRRRRRRTATSPR